MHYSSRRSVLTTALAIGLFSTSVLANPLAQSRNTLTEQEGLGDDIMLSAPDMAKIKTEDGKTVGGPYRYGVQVPVNLSSTNGQWRNLGKGRMRWTMTLVSPAATSLDFHFSQLSLPESATLRILGTGKGNARTIQSAETTGGEFWTPYVAGERATLQIDVDAAQQSAVIAELASATHGYRGLFDQDQAKSGSCNVDTICPAGDAWRDQIDSVGHYTFSSGGSSYVCTGSLIGNTSLNSTPYFLTANHCVSTQTVASTIVVYWNYQSSTCRTPGSSSSGTPLSRSIATHSQSGTTLTATNAASDFALLRLNSNVPAGANPYFSGWDATGAIPSSAVGIHHPAGHEKRIAVENNALTVSGYSGAAGTSHWRVNDWDQGTTEGGSSGSGLWDQNKRLVGQLHGGSAACGNNLSDYYGRLSVSWTGGGTNATRLSNWLSPSGATTLNGYRPGTSGNVAPTANFSVTTSGLTANFTDSSTDSDGSIASRSWNFGDGTTSTATNPSKTYSAAGTYSVSLTVTDNGGLTNTRTQSVTVSTTGGRQTYTNTTDYTISDNTTVNSPITVSGRTGNAPNNASVTVAIVHTYQGDLKVDLVAPDGTLYNIHNRTGGGTDNINKTVTLNVSSEVLNGTWNLRVNDNAGGDVGYINSWSVNF
ncbi:proprotein convertase P-domain-containing protein [Ahniella affigens]|nr:proprotein convertase P-domain-containing protein [Ahniella affigens]